MIILLNLRALVPLWQENYSHQGSKAQRIHKVKNTSCLGEFVVSIFSHKFTTLVLRLQRRSKDTNAKGFPMGENTKNLL